MTWDDVRHMHPDTWVLVEAIGAYSQGAERVIHQIELIDTFGAHWESAWEAFKVAHHEDKNREFYVLHTARPILDIGVIDVFGRILS
jgi:NAD dependent epimerase/dehydratase family enzyme